MILFGISTCDTCKKALKALEAAGHDVTFRDIRRDPLTEAEIGELVAELPTLMKRPLIKADRCKLAWYDYTHTAFL